MIMKRTIPVFLVLILVSGAFFLFSCKGKVSTTGTLTVIAMTTDGVISTSTPVQVYLALSKADLDNKNYVATGWLSSSGSKLFGDLLPKYYWYRVDGWDDFGAAEVFAGVDSSVILWLNTPTPSKK
jgi:hypothetical protein